MSWGEGSMNWAELRDLVEHLPEDSATKAATAGDVEGRRWTQSTYLQAAQYNALLLMIRVLWAAHLKETRRTCRPSNLRPRKSTRGKPNSKQPGSPTPRQSSTSSHPAPPRPIKRKSTTGPADSANSKPQHRRRGGQHGRADTRRIHPGLTHPGHDPVRRPAPHRAALRDPPARQAHAAKSPEIRSSTGSGGSSPRQHPPCVSASTSLPQWLRPSSPSSPRPARSR